MAYEDASILAVVPARGGSKGLPGKNLLPLHGVSLVGHAAKTIRALEFVDHAVISTDDEEIAREAQAQGLECPFMRPAELASDTASSVEMWQHAWRASEAAFDTRFDVSILLEPTSPLRRPEDVRRTLEAMFSGHHAAAATVSPTPAHYTPHKTLKLDKSGRVDFFLETGAKHARRQTIPDYYHRNGICYCVRREPLLERGSILEEDCVAVVIERPIVNIDDLFEFELAEWLMEKETS